MIAWKKYSITEERRNPKPVPWRQGFGFLCGYRGPIGKSTRYCHGNRVIAKQFAASVVGLMASDIQSNLAVGGGSGTVGKDGFSPVFVDMDRRCYRFACTELDGQQTAELIVGSRDSGIAVACVDLHLFNSLC